METGWQMRVSEALRQAEAAKAKGNEGMARVCARRASGWTAEAYLATRGIHLDTTSVLEQLRGLAAQPEVEARVKEICAHLLTPKQRDALESDLYFPLDADLAQEAAELIAALFPSFDF